MKFVIHNGSNKDTIVMIPPGGLDERAFAGVLPYLADYRIVIPVLDGNVIGEDSVLPDRKTEVDRIIGGLQRQGISEIGVLFGVSYGATLALEVLMTRKMKIHKTVLDGGSFAKYGIAMKTMNYIGTSAYVRSVKKKPNKPSMYASLGESIDRSAREVFSQMSKETLKMLIRDSMSGVSPVDHGIRSEDNLIVLYDEKDGYKGGMKWFDDHHYPCKKMILKGYGHCQYFAKKPGDYSERFLKI